MFKLNNKINFFTLTWFIITIVIIILSFTKYSINPAQARTPSEHKLINKITTEKPVNINTASAKELSKLKGVGEKRGLSIEAYRKKHGKFKSLNEIKRVPGLGARFIEDNKGLITLDSDF